MDRFFCPELTPGLVTLPESEARHVKQVLRKSVGESVRLFDGNGRSAVAVLQAIDRGGVSASVEQVDEEVDPGHGLIVAAAVPKADRLKWMIEKLTELDVRRFVPIAAARSVVEPRAAKLEKLNQTVIAACKQCGRDRLMAIEPVTPFADVLRVEARTRLIADVGVAAGTPASSDGSTLVLIGAEGGWTDEERSAASEAGFEGLSLSRTVLRIETAAIAAASLHAAQSALALQN